MEVTIRCPTFISDEVVATYSKIDSVERSGYVPNDKKVESFMQTGSISSLSSGGEYEIDEEESDFEADSPEYLEELEKDATKFIENNEPLSQFMDKITAVEILNDADKKIESEKRTRASKKQASASKEDSIIKAITEGFNRVEKKNKTESEQKD